MDELLKLDTEKLNSSNECIDKVLEAAKNTGLFSDLERISNQNHPINEENQIDSQMLNNCQGFEFNTLASNDKLISTTIPSPINHGYGVGSQMQIFCDEMMCYNEENTMMQEITREILKPLNSNQVSKVNQESIQISEGLLQNYELVNTCEDFDVCGRLRKYLNPNDIKIDNAIYEENTNKNTPNFRQVRYSNHPFEIPRSGISGMSHRIISPSYNARSRNLHFFQDRSAEKIDTTSYNSHLIGVHHEVLTNTDSSHNQETQGHNNLGKTVSQNMESNNSILQCSERSFSSNDIEAVPGASGFHEIQKVQDGCGGKLHARNAIETHSAPFRDKEYFACRICGDLLDGHQSYLDYFCCACSFQTKNRAFLQIHGDLHCAKNVCNICQREYTEGDLHESNLTCIVCQETFKCKTYLDQHSLSHDEHFEGNCWICNIKFNEHYKIIEGRKLYVCCACGHRVNSLPIGPHINLHRPKILCLTCREEYPGKEKNLHNNECECMLCNLKFKCYILLEKHFVIHEKEFSRKCIFCSKYFNNHNFLKCCQCFQMLSNARSLRDHVFTHAGLKLFQCDECGMRHCTKSSFYYHSKSCIPLPFKCEVCRAKFPDNASLDYHRLEKHREM